MGELHMVSWAAAMTGGKLCLTESTVLSLVALSTGAGVATNAVLAYAVVLAGAWRTPPATWRNAAGEGWVTTTHWPTWRSVAKSSLQEKGLCLTKLLLGSNFSPSLCLQNSSAAPGREAGKRPESEPASGGWMLCFREKHWVTVHVLITNVIWDWCCRSRVLLITTG